MKMWIKAEAQVKDAADKMKLNYFIGIGEASFYGPKLDFIVKDAIGREWQLGTVQIDYVMPERFDLTYTGADGQKHRPIIIHRAPFGSLERFIGILIENYAGDFPLWLCPVQVAILPITDAVKDYAKEIEAELKFNKIRCLLDDRNEKIGYKIREAETKKIPYMLVVGEKERENKEISIREHKKGDTGKSGLKEFIEKVKLQINQKL